LKRAADKTIDALPCPALGTADLQARLTALKLPVLGYFVHFPADRASRCLRCADTQALAEGARVLRFIAFEKVARCKLQQHNIRINDQFRLCFI
jgi:hypothetical protein